jgi:hypothetical protein
MQHNLYLVLLAILLDQLDNLLRQLETLQRRGTTSPPCDVDPDGRGERVRDETVDPVEEVGETLWRSRGEEFEGVEGVGRFDEGGEFGHIATGIWCGLCIGYQDTYLSILFLPICAYISDVIFNRGNRARSTNSTFGRDTAAGGRSRCSAAFV